MTNQLRARWRIALIVIGLLLASIVIGCGKHVPQMKTYTNEKYGFLLKYDAAQFEPLRTKEWVQPLSRSMSMRMIQTDFVDSDLTEKHGGVVTGVSVAVAKILPPVVLPGGAIGELEAEWRAQVVAAMPGAAAQPVKRVRLDGLAAWMTEFSGHEPGGPEFTCRLYDLRVQNRLYSVVLQAPSSAWPEVEPALESLARSFSLKTAGCIRRASEINWYLRSVSNWKGFLCAHMPPDGAGGWSEMMHPALRPPADALGAAMDNVESTLQEADAFRPLSFMRSEQAGLVKAIRLARAERLAQFNGNFRWPPGSYVYDTELATRRAQTARALVRRWVKAARFWADQPGVRVPSGLFSL